MRSFACIAALAAASILAFPATANAGDAMRGERLYSQRCHECHAESVHSRTKRSARDFGAIRDWVRHWNSVLKLGWEAEEIEDVSTYLNAMYYGFTPPAATTSRDTLRYSLALPPLQQAFPSARW